MKRLSLSLMHTADHIPGLPIFSATRWTESQAVLLMGVLRAIWDHRSSLADALLVLHIPDPALAKSFRCSPSRLSSEVTEWPHAQVQLLISPLVSTHSILHQFQRFPKDALLRSSECTRLSPMFTPASLPCPLAFRRMWPPFRSSPSRSIPAPTASPLRRSKIPGPGGTSLRGSPY